MAAGKEVQDNTVSTKEAIILAAQNLFEQQGYHATSVQAIVDAAGVTKGAFYHYFQSKEDLLLLVHDQFIDYQLNQTKEILNQGYSPSQCLRKIIEVLMVSVELYKPSLTIFLREWRFLSQAAFREVKRKRDELEEAVVKVIKQGIASGEFSSVKSPTLVGFGIIGMCAWAHQWFNPDGRFSAKEVAEMYADLVLKGLTTRPST